jgi:hypothetical protein
VNQKRWRPSPDIKAVMSGDQIPVSRPLGPSSFTHLPARSVSLSGNMTRVSKLCRFTGSISRRGKQRLPKETMAAQIVALDIMKRSGPRGAIGTLATLVASLAGVALTGEASPITVPPGLAPGSEYRLVFVTTGSYVGSDPYITDYNADVTTEADSVSALASLDTTWSVVASVGDPNYYPYNAIVSAINNVGQDPGVAIYNLAGLLVASDATTATNGLFSIFGGTGSLQNPINVNEDGAVEDTPVWTGSNADGSPYISLGQEFPWTGNSQYSLSGWITSNTGLPETDRLPLYAISGVITVTPEPATNGICLFGVVLLGVVIWQRQPRATRADAYSGASIQ